MININSFASRHIGPRNDDIAAMLKAVHCESLDELIKKTVPEHILFTDKLKLKPGMSEDFNKVNMQLLSLKNKFKMKETLLFGGEFPPCFEFSETLERRYSTVLTSDFYSFN